MRLTTFAARGQIRLGVEAGEWIIDLNRAGRLRAARGGPRSAAQAAALLPPTINDFLAGGEEADVSGERMQEAHTGAMIFSVAQLIAYVSQALTLQPGDLIATGTPSGVGGARKPPRWLREGDTVRVSITGLGVLETPIAAR